MADKKPLSPRFRGDRALLAGLAACMLLGIWFASAPRAALPQLSLTAGARGGLRHLFGEMLLARAAARGLQMRLAESSGSIEALSAVNDGTIDVALIQGGLEVVGRSAVRQVAALHVEPLHLLVKSELFDRVSADLDALRGHTINIGDPGAGTHRLALEVLWFAGVLPRGDLSRYGTRLTTLGADDLEVIARREDMPDAVFLVSALPSPLARRLVTELDYRIVGLPFSEAFSLDALRELARPTVLTIATQPATTRETELATVHVERAHVYEAQIPAFTYGVDPDVPAAPTHTLGTRLLLVANERVPVAAVERLLDIMFNSDFVRIARPALDPSVLSLPPELPLHAGTQRYLERNKPIIAGDLLDYLEKTISIGAAFGGGAFFLWQWLSLRWQRRRDLSFAAYVRKVNELERDARKLERTSTIPLRELMLIQRKIAALKREAIDKFAEGRLAGEELFSSFLAVVNDARDYVTRLIIHERDNLEDEARATSRPLKELWTELVGDLDDPLEPVMERPRREKSA